MKKILAILLALAMTLGCAGALAEMPDAAELAAGGVTVTGSITLNQESILGLAAIGGADLDDSSAAAAGLLVNIINALGVKAVVANNGAQLDVTLKDGTLASLTLNATEEGLVIAADVIPDYVFTVKMETVMALIEQLQSMLPADLDADAIAAAIAPHLQTLLETISAKMGEAEQGEYNVNGHDFTVKVPVNITLKELASAIVGALKGIAEEEAAAPLLSMVPGFDADAIAQTLEQIESSDEAELPVLDAALYSNENGDSYLAVELKRDEQSITLYAGIVENSLLADLNMLDQGTFTLRIVPEEAGVNAYIAIDVEDTQIELTIAAGQTEAGIAVNAALAFNKTPIVQAQVLVDLNGEVGAIDLEGKTAISVEELMAGQNEELNEQLNGLLQNALTGILGRAMQIMPNEFNAVMQMLSPAQEEAAVNE